MSPLVVLLALAVGIAGAEWGLRYLAGVVADRRLTGVIGADVRVSVRGVFAGLRLLTGRAHELVAVARNVPVRGGGARIRVLEVLLRDVDLSLTDSTLRAVGGEFEAHVAGDELDALAGVPSLIGTIAPVGGSLRLTTRAGVGVDATIGAEGGELVVRPASRIADLTRFQLRFGLGDLPGGARVRSVEVGDGEVVVRGVLDGARLTAP